MSVEQKSVYQIKVGRQTRRGTMEPLVERIIETTMTQNQVYNWAASQYKGLAVTVTQAESIEEVKPQEQKPLPTQDQRLLTESQWKELAAKKEKTEKPTDLSYVGGVSVRFTEEEKEDVAKILEKRKEMYKIVSDLKAKVRKRYKALEYVQDSYEPAVVIESSNVDMKIQLRLNFDYIHKGIFGDPADAMHGEQGGKAWLI